MAASSARVSRDRTEGGGGGEAAAVEEWEGEGEGEGATAGLGEGRGWWGRRCTCTRMRTDAQGMRGRKVNEAAVRSRGTTATAAAAAAFGGCGGAAADELLNPGMILGRPNRSGSYSATASLTTHTRCICNHMNTHLHVPIQPCQPCRGRSLRVRPLAAAAGVHQQRMRRRREHAIRASGVHCGEEDAEGEDARPLGGGVV